MQENDLTPQEPRTYEIPDAPSSSKRKTVLVLEDNAAFSEALKVTLEAQDYGVTVVPSGVEGVQKILHSDFDAIVCDMVMPNFPGDMFYRAVQNSRPHLCKRFVFISGHQDNPKVTKFIEDVRGVVLWKPFKMRLLFDALETVTGRSK
jgi:two-component system, cell cycle sensor histidine kinase and response regulator CckA